MKLVECVGTRAILIWASSGSYIRTNIAYLCTEIHIIIQENKSKHMHTYIYVIIHTCKHAYMYIYIHTHANTHTHF